MVLRKVTYTPMETKRKRRQKDGTREQEHVRIDSFLFLSLRIVINSSVQKGGLFP